MIPYGNSAVVLGFAMQEPSSRYTKAFLMPEHFSDPMHGVAWRIINEIADEDERNELPRRILPHRITERDSALAESHIASIFNVGSSQQAAVEHDSAADKILATWQIRRYADAARTVIAMYEQGVKEDSARNYSNLIEEAWLQAEKEVSSSERTRDVKTPAGQEKSTTKLLKDRMEDPDAAFGERCGWGDWDTIHRGARPGRLNFTIAPTGVGKTSFMLNLASRVCDRSGSDTEPVQGLYINCEMMMDDILTRLAAIRLGGAVCLDDLESGTVSSSHVKTAAGKAAASGLHVTDPSPKTIGAVCSLLARYAIRHNIKWACVDHLLEIEMTGDEIRMSSGLQWKLHTGWIRRIHSLAQKYGFCVEVVGQCGGEDMDFSVGKEPSFARMQGAKALLNHVDVARILWPAADGKHVVSIKKNRGGRAGVRHAFYFHKPKGIWDEKGFWKPKKEDDDE